MEFSVELLWNISNKVFLFCAFPFILGHVHSGHAQLPRGHRNGPARERRREKRAAARLEKDEAGKQSDAEEARNVVKPTEEVSETDPDTPKADKVDSKERAETAPVATETKAVFEKEIVVIAVVHDKQANDAAKADIPILKEVEDVFCPDVEVRRLNLRKDLLRHKPLKLE